VRGVFTNTPPVDAYRGAGRPEAAYLVERLVDTAAREIGMDPVELRYRNMIPAAAMPYANPLGETYDSGDFRRTLDLALEAADRAGFAARRAEALARGRRRGLGISSYIEACAGGSPEQTTIELFADGRVVVAIGTLSCGQGHETAYKQLAAEVFGLAPERIEIVQGDTDRVAWGAGTDGSRSGPVGGAALVGTARQLVARAALKAAALLEVPSDTVSFQGGLYASSASNRTLGLLEVAAAVGAGDRPAFRETARWRPPAPTYPNGTHVCEVEVDPETGTIALERYTVVDDFGTVINPLLVAGQVQGGVVQGIGQAIHEDCRFDLETGQLLTGSFVDYGLPRAADVPFIDLRLTSVPSTTNALGMKGAGEAGAIGAPPAVVNAVLDALAGLGVVRLDMPLTPERVWRAIREAAGPAGR
jgi:carbon-monoxide dehydrogenase large subunit